MQNFNNHYLPNQTPQNMADPSRKNEMTRNDAGGYNFIQSDNAFFMRFLCTGAGVGTYQVGTQDLHGQLHKLHEIIEQSTPRIVDTIVTFSLSGRAPSNDPALYALAACMSSKNDDVRKAALNPNALSSVARTGTHLFNFMNYIKPMRGMGTALRRTIASWYKTKGLPKLAYQVLKYRQRNGWKHSDVLRLSHPKPDNEQLSDLLKYVNYRDKHGISNVPSELMPRSIPMVSAFHRVQDPSTSIEEVCNLVKNGGMPWEYIPTDLLRNPSVWRSLIKQAPMGAIMRNLGRLSSIGILEEGGEIEQTILSKFEDKEYVQRSRMHPLNVLIAGRTYSQGNGERGSMVWTPNKNIVEALDSTLFMNCFKNVQPTGKRMMISLDVSGSMDLHKVSSTPLVSCREGALAMAMSTIYAEETCVVNGFSHELTELYIDPTETISYNHEKLWGLRFGRTDCAKPMLYAMEHNLAIDTFVIYTDNETWYGDIHPHQALQQYRRKTGINAKLVSVCMTGTMNRTIADPRDSGMLDISGFDTATPNVISAFSIL